MTRRHPNRPESQRLRRHRVRCVAAAFVLTILGASVLPRSAPGSGVGPAIFVEPIYPFSGSFLTPVLEFFGLQGEPIAFAVEVPPGGGIAPGGLALDAAGNMYVSDFGTGTDDGAIWMLPQDGREPICIMQDLDRPSDIEITPDGRALLIAGPDKRLYRRYFGLSVRVAFGNEAPNEPVVLVETDGGLRSAKMSGDGYFHFPEILAPPQASFTVDMIIRNGPTVVLRPGQFLQLGTFDSGGGSSVFDFTGQTILDVSF